MNKWKNLSEETKKRKKEKKNTLTGKYSSVHINKRRPSIDINSPVNWTSVNPSEETKREKKTEKSILMYKYSDV